MAVIFAKTAISIIAKFGALYDSTLDRYSEVIMFFGLAFFFVKADMFLTSGAVSFTLGGSVMVSYVRARAEAVVTTLDELTEDDLVEILVEPKNALLKQYQKLFELESVELEIDEKALRAVSQEAIKRKTGARGLRAILESVMLEIMYQVPSMEGVQKCIINEDVIHKKAEPALVYDEKSEPDRKLRIS